MTPAPAMRGALPRHTLVWPAAAAHDRLAAQLQDDDARAALREWFERAHPLVVRRVDATADAAPPSVGMTDSVAIGLPLPPARGKRRIALMLVRRDIACHRAPLPLARVAAALPPPWRAPLASLDHDARVLGVTLRAFGSAAWQAITGLAYLRDGSDVDLLFTPRSAPELDAMLGLFDRFERAAAMRIDAEICFAGDRAVAWREWTRALPAARVLAKSTDGARLVARSALFERLTDARA